MSTLTIVFNQNNDPQWSVTTTDGTNVYSQPLKLTRLGNATIAWQLNTAQCNPSDVGFSNTTDTPGVKFSTSWTQNQPSANANNTQWSVTDNVAAGTRGTFKYNIALVTPNGTKYSTDPEVTNSPQ